MIHKSFSLSAFIEFYSNGGTLQHSKIWKMAKGFSALITFIIFTEAFHLMISPISLLVLVLKFNDKIFSVFS